MLSKQHSHPRDDRIQFVEETHTYYIDGSSKGVTSTTTFIHSFFPHFDADKVLSKMKNKKEKYPGMTDAQIKEEWSSSGKKASQLGTKMHACIEDFYNGEYKEEEQTKEFEYFQQFNEEIVKKRGFMPYRTEWSIFDETILLAGQVDMLYQKKDGTYALYDWKRIKELKENNPYEKGKKDTPCSTIDHCNKNHYSLQLNIYKKVLETYYGITVSEMCLVILHPENDSYLLYEVNEMREIVDQLWEWRSKSKK